MGFINPFQIYSKGENTITNNILLLLSNLYRINPKIYELFINSILPENINYEIILFFHSKSHKRKEELLTDIFIQKQQKLLLKLKLQD